MHAYGLHVGVGRIRLHIHPRMLSRHIEFHHRVSLLQDILFVEGLGSLIGITVHAYVHHSLG